MIYCQIRLLREKKRTEICLKTKKDDGILLDTVIERGKNTKIRMKTKKDDDILLQ